MDIKGINKLFTDKVMEYIAEGYMIETRTMAGSQGERARVDLSKDGVVVRIVLSATLSSFHETVFIRISSCTTVELENDWNVTLWDSDFTTIERVAFMQVREGFFVPESEQSEVEQKQCDRYHARRDSDRCIDSSEAKNILLPFVRRQTGCKTATVKDIERVWQSTAKGSGSYHVIARGRHFVLK